jgi:hypothetical protein
MNNHLHSLESWAFRAPIFTELTNSEHLYVQIFLTKDHLNDVMKVKSTDRNPFTPLNKVRLSLRLFSRRSQVNLLKFFFDISSTEFYPRRAKNVENSQNLIYILRWSTLFAVPIFMKLPFAQR